MSTNRLVAAYGFEEGARATVYEALDDGWEDTNDNAHPFVADADYYGKLYATQSFTDLWNTLRYLNDQGRPTFVNVMGTFPKWMGGGRIPTSQEDELVEMVSSMINYGVHQLGLRIDYVSPTNEQDVGAPKGPSVSASQYVRIIESLKRGWTRWAWGLSEGSRQSTAPGYADGLYARPTVRRVSHLAFHNYPGSNGNFDSDVKNSGWAGRDFWVTEYGPGFFAQRRRHRGAGRVVVRPDVLPIPAQPPRRRCGRRDDLRRDRLLLPALRRDQHAGQGQMGLRHEHAYSQGQRTLPRRRCRGTARA